MATESTEFHNFVVDSVIVFSEMTGVSSFHDEDVGGPINQLLCDSLTAMSGDVNVDL